jgi:phosphotransferase system enzyme I (PtsI)
MSIEKNGIAISPGFSVGNALLINQAKTVVEKRKIKTNEIVMEVNRFQAAVEESKNEISKMKQNKNNEYKIEHIEILDFNILILEDEILAGEVVDTITKKQINAEWALNKVLTNKSKEFAFVKDLYMQERLADFYYIAERITKNLRGLNENLFEIKNNTILVAHDLSPIDALKYCRNGNVNGIVTDLGGTTSHTAIIARSLGIPTIMSLLNISTSIEPGQRIYVDGYKGRVKWKVNKSEKDELNTLQTKYTSFQKNLFEFSKLSGETKDKKIISIKANIEISSEVKMAQKYGAEGIGMYRTEFLFTSKEQFPSLDEQYEDYKELFKENPFNEVTIRTLDIGGDKIQDYSHLENNPALGLRGIRYSLVNIDIFKTQLNAIFKVIESEKKKIRILLPMISNIDEIDKSLFIIDEVRKNYSIDSNLLSVGVVIETPSAVLLVEEISKKVNFISVGTNDLIQYTLAADRTNETLENIISHYQPSVVRMLNLISDKVPANTYISICGEMANDINCLPLFIAMGVRELSMNYYSIPRIKSAIHDLSFNDCVDTVKHCLNLTSHEEIKNELSQLIRNKMKGYDSMMDYQV